MADDRNRTVHIYQDSIAEEIYRRLPNYASLMTHILHNMQERSSG